jgi:hypothetical protein
MAFEGKIDFLRSVGKVDKEFAFDKIQQGNILCKSFGDCTSLMDCTTSCIVDAQTASSGKDSAAITKVEARAPILGNFNYGASCFVKPVDLPDGSRIYKDNAIRLPPDETMYPLDPVQGYSCSCKAKRADTPEESFNIICADNTKEDVTRVSKPKRRRF